MQRITIDEIVFCHIHKQFHLSHVMVVDQIAVTRADFTRTSAILCVNLIQYPLNFFSARLKKFSLKNKKWGRRIIFCITVFCVDVDVYWIQELEVTKRSRW